MHLRPLNLYEYVFDLNLFYLLKFLKVRLKNGTSTTNLHNRLKLTLRLK